MLSLLGKKRNGRIPEELSDILNSANINYSFCNSKFRNTFS